jgi:hypothetical protein
LGNWRGLGGGVEGGNVHYAIHILVKCSELQSWKQQLLNRKLLAANEKIAIKKIVG